MKINILKMLMLIAITTVFVGGCVKTNDNQTETTNQNQANNQNTEIVNPSGAYTINELLKMGKPMKCSWADSVGGGDVKNIIYLDGKKMYQDVTMGEAGHSYMISDGEWLYMWNDLSKNASKMKVTEMKTNITPTQEKETAGLDQKRDFVCEKWNVDNAVFNPPKEVEYKDITEEMNQAVEQMNTGGLENAKKQMCDLCLKAPNQTMIDECIKEAGCN